MIRACYTTPCSSSSVQAGLLQCSLGRSSSQFHQTSADNPECCSKPEGSACHTSVHQFSLAPIATRIKFKAVMFAYKTGFAPLYLNSLLQTYVSSRSTSSASEWHIILTSHRGTKSLFTDIYLKCSLQVKWTAQINLTSWVFSHLQEMSKEDTSLPLSWPSNTSSIYSLSLFCLIFIIFCNCNPTFLYY